MSESAKPKANNWLLITFRKYHSWLGVILSVFIIVVCLTGIYLNHKDFFRFTGKKDEHDKVKPAHGASTLLHTGTLLDGIGVSFQQALDRAKERWGEAAVERIELRGEQGQLVYKVKVVDAGELVVSAATGEVLRAKGKGEAKPEGKPRPGDHSSVAPDLAKGAAEPKQEKEKGYDWGKIIKDLHTGKIGGTTGKFLVDATSVVIIILTVSGLYLWYVPIMRKRRSAREREQAAGRQPPASS